MALFLLRSTPFLTPPNPPAQPEDVIEEKVPASANIFNLLSKELLVGLIKFVNPKDPSCVSVEHEKNRRKEELQIPHFWRLGRAVWVAVEELKLSYHNGYI